MNRKKLICLIIALVLVAIAVPLSVTLAFADSNDNGTLIVHFYNGENKYEYNEWNGKKDVSWGVYYWIDVGRIAASEGKDTEFCRDDNVGIKYTIKLSSIETAAIRAGKKLGLIMVKAYTDETDTYVPYWAGNKGKDLPADRMLQLSFDASNKSEIWIIAGDKNNYTSLEAAKQAFDRVEAARFDTFNDVQLQTSKEISSGCKYEVYAIKDAVKEDNTVKGAAPVASGVIEQLYAKNKDGNLVSAQSGNYANFKVNIPDFAWNVDYMLWVEGFAFPISMNKSRLYLSDEFKDACLPLDQNGDGEVDMSFGCIYTKAATTIRLWAPLSTNVIINFYRTGDETDKRLYRSSVDMTRKDKGVWEAVINEDLNGIYYTYTNYVAGEVIELNDPYSSAVGINGVRSMICDLEATNPQNWDNDLQKAQQIRQNESDKAVIWEIHVRDFSISQDSGLTYKGKYLAFTEQNTTTKGNDTLNTGIAYLKELGVNYVHLNPVYDFATVDEEYNNNVDYSKAQNWGYDPKNYNVPEGSYATNAENGEVRVNEFKQMVQALHDAGIGVIMDVVYNHTYTSNSCFDQAVPGYYYRQELNWVEDSPNHWVTVPGSFNRAKWTVNALGAYNLSDGSGCSNETASEREMYRSYMIDSVKYWAEEYHVDGFRFDLMGCHDVETMNKIRSALNGLPAGNGILIYGEPWAAASVGLDPSFNIGKADYNGVPFMQEGIKVFNSTIREAIKGDNSPSMGFVQGDLRKVGGLGVGLNGDINDKKLKSASDSVIYTTSHDNYTLWDQLVNTMFINTTPTLYSEGNGLVVRRNMAAATFVLMGKGTAFILAGEEVGRTKYGNHNSYNAQDRINAFDYYRKQQNASLFNWYKGLIELRTNKFTTMTKANADMFNGLYENSNTYYFGYNRLNAGDKYSKVMVLSNSGNTPHSIPYGDSWQLIADSSTGVFDFNGIRQVGNGNVVVPANTTYIIVQN